MNTLRFAPLIRVSTERQEKQGESLRTQKKQLESAIESLGGIVYRWYEGQEHGTPDYERKILEQLMEDAVNHRFDAVIVADISRWSRDNAKSATDLKTLKDNHIRFFALTTEYDLYDAFAEYMVSHYVLIHDLEAKRLTERITLNKKERARRGLPSSGRIPYGRTFDKKTSQWGVDPARKARIQEIANLYLETDTNFEKLAKQYGMNQMNLRKILVKSAGSEFQMTFKNKKDNTKEVMKLSIPPLLDDITMANIRAKAEARCKWDRPKRKHSYLLAGKVLDAETGYTLTGSHVFKTGRRFYYSYKPTSKYSVDADTLEKAFWESLVEALSDSRAMVKAVFEDEPEERMADALIEKKVKKEQELTRVNQRIENIWNGIEHYPGKVPESYLDEQQPKLTELADKKEKLTVEIQAIIIQLQNIPSEAEIEGIRQELRKQLERRQQVSYFTSGHTLNDLSFDERRRLINLIFGGKDFEGKRYGVYLKKMDDKRYSFTAYGVMGDFKGYVTAKGGEYYSEPDYEVSLNDSKNVEITKKIAKELNLGMTPSSDKVAVDLLREII